VRFRPEPGPRLEAKRARIIDAALRHFAEQGYHAARIEDLAAQLGFAKGSIFQYFGSKAGLFLETYKKAVKSFPAYLDCPANIREKGFFEIVRYWLLRTERLVREDGRLFHQLWTGTAWTDCCEFTFDEMWPIDCEVANWWTSTSPASHFRTGVTVGRAGRDGTRKAIREGEFTHRRGAEILARTPVTSTPQLLAILAEHFDLHFPAGTRFDPV